MVLAGPWPFRAVIARQINAYSVGNTTSLRLNLRPGRGLGDAVSFRKREAVGKPFP